VFNHGSVTAVPCPREIQQHVLEEARDRKTRWTLGRGDKGRISKAVRRAALSKGAVSKAAVGRVAVCRVPVTGGTNQEVSRALIDGPYGTVRGFECVEALQLPHSHSQLLPCVIRMGALSIDKLPVEDLQSL